MRVRVREACVSVCVLGSTGDGVGMGSLRPCSLRGPQHARAVGVAVAAAAGSARRSLPAPPPRAGWYAKYKETTFPFTAIVGQEDMKVSLLLNVVDPHIGGALIVGDRGTGKSVAVAALANLLPEIEVITGDPYNSHPTDRNLQGAEARALVASGAPVPVSRVRVPIVQLPLGATEDRIVGTIDVDRALSEGVIDFQPGLLARANRGILYVDEVGLLADHLVDCVLDSAAMKWNYVEREGVSVQHPANFTLIGSGGLGEGELRPQLLDRFALYVSVRTLTDLDQRVELVRRCNAYAEDPWAFCAAYEAREGALREALGRARDLLPRVTMDRALKVMVSDLCSRADVDGIRGDLTAVRSAVAHAALLGRTHVTVDDVERVLLLSLWHRLRKDPMDPLGGALAAMKIRGLWNAVKTQRRAVSSSTSPSSPSSSSSAMRSGMTRGAS